MGLVALLPVWNVIKKVLMFTIPLPVWALLIVGIWFHFDKTSAVKQALAQLVASAELAAKDAIIESKNLQIKFVQENNVRQAKLLEIEKRASDIFESRLNEINSNSKELKDKLDAIASSGKCDVIDDDFLKLLQSDQ